MTVSTFKRLFVVNGGSAGWTDSCRTTFIISVEDNMLDISCISGRDMFTREIIEAFILFLQEYEQETGEKIARFQRKNYYRFCFRAGMSGCEDVYIEYTEKSFNFPTRKHLFHESCFGKCPGFKCFLYDYMDYLVAKGVLSITDGNYCFEGTRDEKLNIKVVKPRIPSFEEGWHAPDEKPSNVVYLSVTRETHESSAEDEEAEDDE